MIIKSSPTDGSLALRNFLNSFSDNLPPALSSRCVSDFRRRAQTPRHIDIRHPPELSSVVTLNRRFPFTEYLFSFIVVPYAKVLVPAVYPFLMKQVQNVLSWNLFFPHSILSITEGLRWSRFSPLLRHNENYGFIARKDMSFVCKTSNMANLPFNTSCICH